MNARDRILSKAEEYARGGPGLTAETAIFAGEVVRLRARVAELESEKSVVLPHTVNVDGYVDERGIRYLGDAERQSDGKYLCLADVNGALCRVEARLTFSPMLPSVGSQQGSNEE